MTVIDRVRAIITASAFFVSMVFLPAAYGQASKPDVAIIGAGGAGIAAASVLAEGGAKVVVFEKMPYAGGSTNYGEGSFGAETDMQLKKNIKITREDTFKGIMEYSHWKANASLVRAFVDKSADTIAWLEREGVEFDGLAGTWLGGPLTWHLYKGYAAAMMKVIVNNAVKKGVEIRYETPVVRILREDNGPVTGVIAEDKQGNQIKVAAKAVIVATGGYANNKEWMKKYAGFDLGVNMFPVGNTKKMGDGIRMAWEVGAAEEGMGLAEMMGGVIPGLDLKDHIFGAYQQPSLWVNQHGRRYCDESIVRNMVYAGNAMARQKGGYDFRIFDETTKRVWAEKGVDVGAGMYFLPPRTKLVNLNTDIKKAIEKKKPYIFVANSLDELAEKMGVNRAAFLKTVEEYNGFCAKGHDDQFGKDRVFLRPVKTAPFYATKTDTSCLGTLGGIKINEKIEVLDKDEKVIPGLYAAGNDAGGLYGDSYDVVASGMSSGFALTSGRIAGENSLKYIGK